MAESEISGKLEELSEALVFAEPSDLQALSGLHTQFQEIGAWAKQKAQAEVEAAASAAAELIEGIILEEVEDAQASMELIGRIVGALQSVICEGVDPKEVEFPHELGLGSTQPSRTDQEGSETQGERQGLGQESEEGGADSASGIKHPTSLPAHADESIFAEFLERQSEGINEMETMILDLEKSDDGFKLGALRRFIHTLKGESALLGLADVERLCHTTEDALNEGPPETLVDALLTIKDWLSGAFDAYSGKGPAPGPVDELLAMLADPTRAAASAESRKRPDAEAAAEEAPESNDQAGEADEQIPEPAHLEADPSLLGDFVSEALEHLEASDLHLLTLETDPESEEALNAVFRAFHTIKGVAGFLALDQVQSLSHEAESLLDLARKGKIVLAGTAIDVTFDAVDALKNLIGRVRDCLSSGQPLQPYDAIPALVVRIKTASTGKSEPEQKFPASPADVAEKKLGEILVDSGAASKESVVEALGSQKQGVEKWKLGEILVLDGEAEAKDVAHALRTQQKAKVARKAAVHVKEIVKVDAERLDRLIDTIGELVIAESMVTQSDELLDIASTELSRHVNQLDKITRELQAMGTSLRMVPVRATFQKMARLVRDLGKKANKAVEFVMAGEDTELDKTVVDRIGDPLVHMIRNAVDHGLEASPEDRKAAGKPATGRVELRAYHKGGNIYIEVEDDGRGLDREAILAKARERGMVGESDVLSDREVFSLIFEPGFSTAKKVTDVSGRGVGMDVVRRNIDALRGQVEIRSEAGKGSVFTIRLPLTLAIIDGMVIRVGSERYVIPTLSVVMSIRPDEKDLSTVLSKGEMLTLQGSLIPLFRLGRLFSIDGAEADPSKSLVVIVEDDGKRTGLITDELLGQQQIVIKSLGETMRGIPGVSGGAIMPDGQVGLILDVGGLIKLANAKDNGTP